jgi:hypothetical protein
MAENGISSVSEKMHKTRPNSKSRENVEAADKLGTRGKEYLQTKLDTIFRQIKTKIISKTDSKLQTEREIDIGRPRRRSR